MTIKQKLTAQKMLENGGNVSKSMREAGYSAAMVKNPQKLTRSKGWRALMDKYLPDKTLLEVHQEGLKANRVISAINTDKQASGRSNDFIEVPDHAVRHKFLETAYKLKGCLHPDNQTLQQFNGDITVTWANGEEAK